MNAPAPTVSVAGLCAALVAAQAAARAVAKDAQNTFHRYKYASAEAIIAEAREALSGAGLAFLVTGWQFVAAQAGPDGFPGGVIGRVEVAYRLVHTSGEAFDMACSTPVIPEKGRPADKAEAAALTANLAYMLRGLLLLPRDDDQAALDARDDRGYQPATRAAEPPRHAPAAPDTSPRAAAQAQQPRPVAQPGDEAPRPKTRDWSEVVSVVERAAQACTTADQLKAEVVPIVKSAQADGMPDDVVRRCQAIYGERKAALTRAA